MTVIKHQQHQQKILLWMCFLLIVAMLELLSCIPSTDGFATAISGQRTTPTRTKRIGGSGPTALFDAEDPHRNLPNNDEHEHEPSCVLKERNPYDVHVYYCDADEREAALELRQKMHRAFGDWMRFYPPKDRPIGPHPLPMWEADFGGYEHRHKWKDVRDFLLEENSDNLSVLIHPHSLDGDYADHTTHAFWAGRVLELRIRGWR